MIARDLIDRLAEHRALASVPRTELEWLVAHGSLRRLNTEEILSAKGRQVESLYIILSGHLALFVDRGAGPIKIMEWRDGGITGILPYSRLAAAPGNVIALAPVEIFAVPREFIGEMIRECSEICTILVHVMLDRARLFTSSELQNEKMMSLGKLSAGLAHELNNPASAIERCAAMLEDRLEEVQSATRDLASATLSDAQIAAVDAVRASCMEKSKRGPLSPLERLDREEAISEWLSSHGLDTANTEKLADTEVTFEALNCLAAAIERPSLNAALRWAAAGCAVKSLTSRIQDSSMCISSLVTAIKGFTHMDQANVAEPVDLGTSLDHTVTVLKSKAREKSVAVTLNLEAELPKARGFAGELNQVWGNLIDNALDAVGNDGRVEVSAFRESRGVVVQIRDDGPGIAEGIRDRIFDPFFSTKPMGQGNGLGLDIVRRLVLHNDGAIEFESQPGLTDFRVKLPIASEA
ncbi:sensor histidine kinase [Edaphobacter dinghuensis]|uniref:histidine kinase n=1 Tax=Edaphobacter dinghuensis TaxID=1560005 RepID=A0A917M177_9BACT|nr:ATP-binding protein [Edaphobacter dinghuensis]GGG71240.1 sensor histidine kinase [Edaphobacter dinghuensis]